MSHTRESRTQLLSRIRRIRGQVDAIEKALNNQEECANLLQLIAATRGAMTGLMSELVEGHIRHHVLAPKAGNAERESAEELIGIVRSYFK